MGSFMYEMTPNEDGDLECIAMELGNNIHFKITEIDLRRMAGVIELAKRKKVAP